MWWPWRRKLRDPFGMDEASWSDEFFPADDPLTLAVNRAANTGEMVLWREGDPLPDPEGPVRKVSRG